MSRTNQFGKGYAVPFDKNLQLRGTSDMLPIASPDLGTYETTASRDLGIEMGPDNQGNYFVYGQLWNPSDVDVFAGAVCSFPNGGENYQFCPDISLSSAKGEKFAGILLADADHESYGWFWTKGKILSIGGTTINIKTDGGVAANDLLCHTVDSAASGVTPTEAGTSNLYGFGIAHEADNASSFVTSFSLGMNAG